MIRTAFHEAIFQPLYNGLVYLIQIVPGHDVGLAVIALTVIVRVIIYPLSQRAVHSQQALKKITPEIEALKKKYPDNSPEQARAIFALYKERGVHPFAGIGLLLVQLPILIGLYLVFAHGGLPQIDAIQLYSFVKLPEGVDMHFLGMDMSAKHNIILAALTALSQAAYTRLSLGPVKEHLAESSFSGDMARSFDLQARYVLPLIIGIVAFSVVAAAPLYWVTSNIFMIAQEYLGGRRFRLDEK